MGTSLDVKNVFYEVQCDSLANGSVNIINLSLRTPSSTPFTGGGCKCQQHVMKDSTGKHQERLYQGRPQLLSEDWRYQHIECQDSLSQCHIDDLITICSV